MKLTEMFPSNLLKSQDVTDAGGEMILTIKSIEMAEFDNDNGGKESKPVVMFVNDKKMVLNKTNAKIIATMHGDDTDLWIGKDIILNVLSVPFGDKMTPAIRVKDLNSRDVLVQSFWSKARELGYTPEQGRELLKKHDGNFAAAEAELTF